MCIDEKFEEVRGLSSTKAGDGGIVLVRMIFPGELPIVDFDLRFGRSQAKSEDGE